MARLFGKDYHELSSTWSFTSKILPLNVEDVEYHVVRNEKGYYNIRFHLLNDKNLTFPDEITIVYDPKSEKIINHISFHPTEYKNYNYYYSIIQYGYNHLSTDIFAESKVIVYSNKMLSYNEHWQTILLNSKIFIEGLYLENSQKIRFYFIGYEDIDLRNIALTSHKKSLPEGETINHNELNEQITAFSDAEIELLKHLGIKKCSYSKKNCYFTLYKDDLIEILPTLKELSYKILIKETGEPLLFPTEAYPLTLRVEKSNDAQYKIRLATGHYISQFFVKNSTYLLVENKIYSLQLPFKREIIEQIFTIGYVCNEYDVIYLASVAAKQTGLVNCYLDFAEDITLPSIYSSSPQFQVEIKKIDKGILLSGQLNYQLEATLPINSLYFNSELIGLQEDDETKQWFYVPYQTRKEVIEFIEALPTSDAQDDKDGSVYIYHTEEKKDWLKQIVHERFKSEWELNLDDELKNEFISKVTLKPIVTVIKTDRIDWFEYKVEYKIHNLTLTHEQLREFFGSKEKYMKLPDNRLIDFTDNKSFSQLDLFLKNIAKSNASKSRLRNYNLTYLYALSKMNTDLSISGDEYLNTMFSDLLRRRTDENTTVPLSLFNVMRSYQKLGFYWLKMLQKHRLGGILADDMGLGKTLQTLALLSDYYQQKMPEHKKSLVVCPKTLLFNWGTEIEKFHPNLTYTIYEGTKESRANILTESTSDIIIVSYTLVHMDIDLFSQYSYAYVVLDEAQHIKNPATLKSKSIKKVEAEHKIALTGTPMENNAVELWSIFDFLMPGYLQSLRSFKKSYSEEIEDEEEKENKKVLLAQIISPFLFRRKKNEVLLELPDKQTQIIYNRMTTHQEKLYLKILAMAKERLNSAEEASRELNYINVLTILMRLRQVCNHPGMLDKNFKNKANSSAKLESLISLIEEAINGRRKILVFSQFTSMLRIVASNLDKLGITYEYMDGKTVDRQEKVERFSNNEQIRVFLLTLKVGGLGLNLTAADTVILIDPWWNPMSEDQSIDRAYRIGQTKKVFVYKLVTKGSIEEKILQLQDKKRSYFENVVENSQTFIKKLTVQDLKELFEYQPQ